ncbi:MAG TPA: hypothetical protein VFB14_18300 [Bryobacteraceae bacterium]|jgi:hypothetical protein|nr:hypothetical protein [Bryobacteraceae bacterium]
MSRKAHTRNFPVLFVIAALTFLTTKPAEASPILITGRFAGASTTNSPIQGGSFSLAFDATGLPVSPTGIFIYSWELVFRSATGAVVADLDALQRYSFGTIQPFTGSTAGDELKVGNSSSQNYLFLLLPAGFTGTGNVIPSSSYSYAIANGSNPVPVSAGAVAPEPGTTVCPLVGLAVLGVLALKGNPANQREGRSGRTRDK